MKTFLLLTILSTMIFMTGCQAINQKPEITTPTMTEEPTTEMTDFDPSTFEDMLVKSQLARETSPQIDRESILALARDNTYFALAFYDQIRSKEGNIIFSPLSLSLALSMTLAGAETSTETAMLDALQLSLPESQVHPAFNALLLQIEDSQSQNNQDSGGTDFQLNIANSIWGQSGYQFREAFLNTLAVNYGSGIYNLDFSGNPEASRNAINKWVEKETKAKIKNLIPQGAINPLTRLVLANAIYFNGSWMFPFSESGTEKAPFTTLDGSEISVEMMMLYGQTLRYGNENNYQAVTLNYTNSDFAMTILLPDEGQFSQFEADLKPQQLQSLLDNMTSEQVNLRMPKFDFETTTDAKDTLVALGMDDAFDENTADFSGISEDDRLFITDVLHKATITVDEKGTEAAAATAVIVGLTSMKPDEPISLTIDRPFIFVIQHQPTGAILFMGRVLSP